MKAYLGVDAGGTKTNAMITDEEGRLLAIGKAGPGNHQIHVELAKNNIYSAVHEALNSAALQVKDIAVAWFGLAGADREADYRILRPIISELGFAQYEIVCDTIIALRAGSTRSYGVVSICGTGTNCAGVNPRGDIFQCGGFGYAYGDFGGGSELAVEAFRSVIRAWEGRTAPTLLTDLVLEKLRYDSVEQLFHHSLDTHLRIPADLTPLVFKAASSGDMISRQILKKQGEELGISAKAVIQKLGMQNEVFDLVLAGSVLAKGVSDFIHPYIAEQVAQVAEGCQLRILGVEPVIGAVFQAMEKDGIHLTDAIYANITQVSHV
ncbi:N-acetylglucosamine kinase [Paenibacillus sp. N3.4]|uniref:N-acetylglucosamine kinase n=1 Tax=Paenibacillus sp. N3.4 TaxID=2603222 RepID=UPI0011CA3405|nr:BadF/BadG/BcrA/BcrD ATPase family protein [Paenibacillus sp. N3.4]TXK84370.1 ATPase [Paenibacillus sp. N3.4]